MKKSQLKKLIKESIKQLMAEQSTNARYIQVSTCWGANTRYRHATVDGGIPQVGQMLDWTFMGRTWFITAVQTNPWNSPQGIQNIGSYQGTTCCPHLCGTSVNLTPVWNTNNPNYGMTGMNNVGCSGNGNMCCGNSNYAANAGSNCPTLPSSGCPGWSNYSNWLNTFTNTINNLAANPNPNQPCQFLCQRNTQWSAQIPTVGPNWANQLQCKLDEVQSLMQTHNCSNSNASNC